MKSIFSFGNTPIATCVLATFKPHCISHCVAGIEIGLIRCYTIYTNMVWATLLFTTKFSLLLKRMTWSFPALTVPY